MGACGGDGRRAEQVGLLEAGVPGHKGEKMTMRKVKFRMFEQPLMLGGLFTIG